MYVRLCSACGGWHWCLLLLLLLSTCTGKQRAAKRAKDSLGQLQQIIGPVTPFKAFKAHIIMYYMLRASMHGLHTSLLFGASTLTGTPMQTEAAPKRL
jgi:hypothetical protein